MQNPLAPFVVIATNDMFCDPAINVPEQDEASLQLGMVDPIIAEYRRTRDVDELRKHIREGMALTEFQCKPLPSVFVRFGLSAVTNVAIRRYFAFVSSCHCVQLPEGVEMKPEKFKSASHGVQQATEEWYQKIVARFGSNTVDEVADVILERAQLPEGKRGPFVYRLG